MSIHAVDKKVLVAIDEIQCSYNQDHTKSFKLWSFLKQVQASADGQSNARALLAAAYGARPSGLEFNDSQGSPQGTPITIFPHLIVTTQPPSATKPVSLRMRPEDYQELCSLFKDHSGLQFEPFTLDHVRALCGLQVSTCECLQIEAELGIGFLRARIPTCIVVVRIHLQHITKLCMFSGCN
jgi:hypothetical protein